MIPSKQFIGDNREQLAPVVNVSGGKDSARMLGFSAHNSGSARAT